MPQRYFWNSAKILAVACFLISFMSQNFHYVAATCFAIAACLYLMGRAQQFEYDPDRVYGLFSLDDKAQSCCNLGWAGLLVLTVLLLKQYWFTPVILTYLK